MSKKRSGQRVNVFLTHVGGGVFGNDPIWIYDAIKDATKRYINYPLDVYEVAFVANKDFNLVNRTLKQ